MLPGETVELFVERGLDLTPASFFASRARPNDRCQRDLSQLRIRPTRLPTSSLMRLIGAILTTLVTGIPIVRGAILNCHCIALRSPLPPGRSRRSTRPGGFPIVPSQTSSSLAEATKNLTKRRSDGRLAPRAEAEIHVG